jgi:fluoride exporter
MPMSGKMLMLSKLGILLIAGGMGTLARFFCSGFAQRICGGSFFWGTLTVNMLGCFMIGVIWSMAENRIVVSHEAKFFMLTGFMGAFTTFSTFAFETSQLVRDGQWSGVAINLIIQNVVGVSLVLIGIKAGRLFA